MAPTAMFFPSLSSSPSQASGSSSSRPHTSTQKKTTTLQSRFLKSGLKVASLFSTTYFVSAQQSINLHAKLSINKNENTAQLLEHGQKLVDFAKKEQLHSSILIFLDNMKEQLKKLNDASNKVQDTKKKEKANYFTAGKDLFSSLCGI